IIVYRSITITLLRSMILCVREKVYFYTGVSGINDFPEFTIVGLVDEGQFMYFDSNIKKAVPKTEWIRQNVGADYWDRQTQICIGSHQTYKVDIQTLKGRFNQSTGKLVTNLPTHTFSFKCLAISFTCQKNFYYFHWEKKLSLFLRKY
uniref:MHC class I-like antigen recognition-like domain-containing protein n=1 Tax=Cyprinus carpio TaxID=7962 RepID=A0A8C1X479_CYPCA